MKFLFKITRNNIDTLLRGVDFSHDLERITFLKENISISISDLNQILVNAKLGYVIFTDDQSKCKELQKEIKKRYSRRY